MDAQGVGLVGLWGTSWKQPRCRCARGLGWDQAVLLDRSPLVGDKVICVTCIFLPEASADLQVEAQVWKELLHF